MQNVNSDPMYQARGNRSGQAGRSSDDLRSAAQNLFNRQDTDIGTNIALSGLSHFDANKQSAILGLNGLFGCFGLFRASVR